MKCTNCGFESEQEFAFCVQCGVAAQVTQTEGELVVSESAPYEPMPINPLLEKTRVALKDSLFLVLCILVTMSAGFGLGNGQLPLLGILASVFLWIVYAKSRRDDVHVEGLRCISGVVFADYVVSYVVTGLLVLIGVLLTVVIGIAAGSTMVFDEIINEFGVMDAEYIDLIEILLSASAPLICLVFLLIATPIFLINFFGTRKIHGFVKSLYKGIQEGETAVRYGKGAKTWLLVLGIVSVVSSMFSLPGICSGAAMIVASVLVGRHFNDEQ